MRIMLEALGIPPRVPLDYRMASLTTAQLHDGFDEAAIRSKLLNDYNVEIVGGFGPLAGQIWRIGLMGYSSRRENVELLINALRLKEDFDVLISAAEVKNGKPAPDVFLISAEKLKIKPKNCLVIEDAPVGIEAAKRAGMKSIALTTTHEKNELLNADLIVKDLSEVSIQDIMLLLNIVQK